MFFKLPLLMFTLKVKGLIIDKYDFDGHEKSIAIKVDIMENVEINLDLIWLEKNKKLYAIEIENMKMFMKLGASKKCAKRMARKSTSFERRLYSSTMNALRK